VIRPVTQGQSLGWDDVAIDTTTAAYKVRREMETLFNAAAPDYSKA
jgi:predicted homoserine dehydrogenase-like protein